VSSSDRARDIGNGLVCASFGAGGAWLSLATVDPDLGFLELTGMPPFDEAGRGDPAAVRRYRSGMREAAHAFLTMDAGLATVTSLQEAPPGKRGISQQIVITAQAGSPPARVELRFRGRLARPAYAEITEVDPPRWQAHPTRLEVREGSLGVIGEGRPVTVQVRSAGDGGSAAPVQWRVLTGPVAAAEADVRWPAGAQELRIDIACTFELSPPVRPAWVVDRDASGARIGRRARKTELALHLPARLSEPAERISRRALDYVRDCTALQVGGAERCILADHRMLPLSWTRDAYWQARSLLAARSREQGSEDVAVVADHLRWLFLRCERPDGRWVRSHYADGRRKDRPFQADQQLYPILELSDHVVATGSPPELPPGPDWAELVREAWAVVDAATDTETGLVRADENPADDLPSHPFLLSNQILLSRTASRLALTAGAFGMSPRAFADVADRTKAAVEEHLVVDGPLGRQWAYAIDAQGGAERYHDANDLPVALAPLWGFCAPDDPVWLATMAFAFDDGNPGFVGGSHGGLGSRHTPGTWTLGDIQRWVAASLVGGHAEAEAALERLIDVAAGNDWMLPEAYDPGGSGDFVRHWFAWPGSAFSVLFLDHVRIEG
jgi:hypothetical protein